MNENDFLKVIDKIFKSVFNTKNPFNLEELREKLAFDIKLPIKVHDSTTDEITWANSTNNNRFITNTNMNQKDTEKGWMLDKKEITSLQDIIDTWNSINYITTERVYDSLNVYKSDTIYNCENVYHSSDCNNCKNIIYSNSCGASEYVIACQRSYNCTFVIRTDDSNNCSNSYNVICSNKVSNSLFIQDCYNVHECIFCSHIANKRFCIANMQFTEEEYYQYKKAIINWLLSQL